jgi:hypothetical protein
VYPIPESKERDVRRVRDNTIKLDSLNVEGLPSQLNCDEAIAIASSKLDHLQVKECRMGILRTGDPASLLLLFNSCPAALMSSFD